MSLKTFHIIFIGFSTIFSFGFGVWFIKTYNGSGDASNLLAAVASFLVGIGLIIYGIKFLRKLQHVRFL